MSDDMLWLGLDCGVGGVGIHAFNCKSRKALMMFKAMGDGTTCSRSACDMEVYSTLIRLQGSPVNTKQPALRAIQATYPTTWR